MWLTQLGRALNEADGLRAELTDALQRERLYDALIIRLQDTIAAQRQTIVALDPPLMISLDFDVIQTVNVSTFIPQDEVRQLYKRAYAMIKKYGTQERKWPAELKEMPNRITSQARHSYGMAGRVFSGWGSSQRWLQWASKQEGFSPF